MEGQEEKMRLVKSLAKICTVEYNQEENNIKVNHPLYDISLIDKTKNSWDRYLSQKTSSPQNYKSTVQIGAQGQTLPKSLSKSYLIRAEIDPEFQKSAQYETFLKETNDPKFGPKKFTSARNVNNRRPGESLLAKCGKRRFISDYGVNFNQDYKYYDDDTMYHFSLMFF